MLKIAHRGASAYKPENTLSAFTQAVELGADGIELDLHLCASGELVVIHDDTVNRTTNGKGRVAQMTLAELKALRIHDTESIPTLEEVFEALGSEMTYFLECKHVSAMAKTALLIKNQAAKGWDARKLTLISFEHKGLGQTLEAFPELAVGASFERLDRSSAIKAKRLGAQRLLPKFRALTQGYCEEAHALGLSVIPWTVNDPADIAAMRALGVDGIISDYPDRL